MPAPRILKPSSGTKRSPTRRRRLSFSPDVLVTSLDLRKSELVPLEGEPPREDPLVALDLKGKLERASSPPATKHQAAPATASPAAAAAPEEAAGDDPVSRHADEDGTEFWHNARTGTTHWTLDLSLIHI